MVFHFTEPKKPNKNIGTNKTKEKKKNIQKYYISRAYGRTFENKLDPYRTRFELYGCKCYSPRHFRELFP